MAKQTKSNNTVGHILHTNVPQLRTLTERERVLCKVVEEACGSRMSLYVRDCILGGTNVRTIAARLKAASELCSNSNLR